MNAKIAAYVDAHRDEIIAMWEDLVNQESGSSNKAGVDAVVNKVKAALEENGAEVKIMEHPEAGNGIVAMLPGGNKKPFLFLGHMDTVFNAPGETVRRPFTIDENGKVTGPGVLDMKGGVVIGVWVGKALKACGWNDRPIKYVLSGDEEVGHYKSTNAKEILEESKGCVACFDCETSYDDNSTVSGRKGACRFQVGITGVTSHAGNDPKRGRSAILEAAHKVIDIQNLTNWDLGITFNVGNINGGTIFNAVPGYCELDVDIRYENPEHLPMIEKWVQETCAKTYIEGTTTEIMNYKVSSPPFAVTEGGLKLFDILNETSQELGYGALTHKYVGGFSDAAYSTLAGVPTMCSVGVKGGFNHSPEEYCWKESIFERIKVLAGCILKIDRME